MPSNPGGLSSIHSMRSFADPHTRGTHVYICTHIPNFPTHLPCFFSSALCRACTKNNTRRVQFSSTLRGQKWTNLERSLGHHQKEPWQQIKSPLSTAGFTANYLSSLPTTTEPHLPSPRQLPAAPPPGSHVRPALLPLHFTEIMLTM